MKTVLVTGANGQLGNSIHARISQYPGYNFLFTDIDTLDICDKEAVRKYVLENDVQYVMNCAAYTAVDKAEEHEDPVSYTHLLFWSFSTVAIFYYFLLFGVFVFVGQEAVSYTHLIQNGQSACVYMELSAM